MSTPSPQPRQRRAVIAVLVVVAVATVSVAVPGSPLHLPVLLGTADRYDGRTLRQWASALDDPDPVTRREAVVAVGWFHQAALRELPKLTYALRNDQTGEVRAAAAYAIGQMAPGSKSAVPVLADALADPDPLVRLNAAQTLGRMRADARPAVSALLAAADDEENDVIPSVGTVSIRQVVITALGHAAAGTDVAVPLLARLLEAPTADDTRAATVRSLGLSGPAATSAAPRVRSLLHDPSPDVRFAAAEALARMGAPLDGPTTTGELDHLQLPESERARLWDIEHHVNLLNGFGFDPLAKAIRAADEKTLRTFMSADFAGTDLNDPKRVAVNRFVEVERLQDAGKPGVPLSADLFLTKMLGLRKLFTQPPGVKVTAATLKPKDPRQTAGSWEGKAVVRMHGERVPGAPCEVILNIRYEVAKPTEETLANPGWLRAVHVTQQAVSRAPQPLFVETAEARGLKTAGLHDNWTADETYVTTGGVFVTDFDRDGYLDVLVTDVSGTFLYRGGPGGRFTEVTETAGLPTKWAGGLTAAWVDLDGDGWDDLILDGRVYRNLGTGRFEDYTRRSSLKVPMNVTSILVADFDRDGKLDLYFARTGRPGRLSWLEGRSSDPMGNRLFRNLGDWKFEDVTKKSGTRGGFRSCFTAAWLDANDDGWPDLHVPNEFGDGVLLLNQKDGTFRPAALADRPADFGTMGMAAGDLDNDGHIDLYCANMYSKAGTRVIGNMAPDSYPAPVMEKFRRFVAGSQYHRNRGDGTFQQLGAEKQLAAVGWAYGPALADLDGDGFLDVYATAGYMSRDRDKPDG